MQSCMAPFHDKHHYGANFSNTDRRDLDGRQMNPHCGHLILRFPESVRRGEKKKGS
jgi:hypothetical protein